MRSIFNKTLLLIAFLMSALLIIIHNYSSVSYISLAEYEEIYLKNIQLQGIECIDKEVLLLEERGNIFLLNDKILEKIASFYRPYAKTQKEKNVLVHPNSLLVLSNGSAFASNTLTRLSAKIVKFDFKKLISDFNLSKKNIDIILRPENIRSIHLEKIYYLNNEKILKAEKSFDSKYYNFTINDTTLNKHQCEIEINETSLQNLFWENNKTLYVVKNTIGNIGGLLKTYRFKNINLDCPSITKSEIKIYSTLMELEGYIKCNKVEYVVFIKGKDSVIYKKNLT